MSDVKQLPKSITIIGREWFRKSYGNTYQSAQIVVDGVLIGTTHQTCGYGDQYLYDAFEMLERLGTIQNFLGNGNAPWQWCQENSIVLYHTMNEVRREKDLF